MPRKLRLLVDESVTGRSLLKLPLKLSNVMSPRALAGSRSVTSPLNVLTFRSSPSVQLAACDVDAAAEGLDAHRP